MSDALKVYNDPYKKQQEENDSIKKNKIADGLFDENSPPKQEEKFKEDLDEPNP